MVSDPILPQACRTFGGTRKRAWVIALSARCAPSTPVRFGSGEKKLNPEARRTAEVPGE